MFNPVALTTMPTPFTDAGQNRQPEPPPAEADTMAALASEAGSPTEAAPSLLRDLVLQAAQRAWQDARRTHAEAQALQARNAFD